MKRYLVFLAAISLIAKAGYVVGGIIVHTNDFIDDSTRSHFNGFESIPNVKGIYTGGHGPYVEDGIVVEQITNEGNIWVTMSGETPDEWRPEGSYSWYPNNGDYGPTKVTLQDGSDFVNVGFLRGSGGNTTTLLLYELYDNGSRVLSGSVSASQNASYLGFSGGGFDEILMWDNFAWANCLVIDSIETSGTAVPLPGDANGDGTTNGADLNIVLSNYNQSGKDWAHGDFDGNGTVDGADLNTVLSNYNQSIGVGAALPEPSTLLLMAACLVGLLCYAWRKRKQT
jgi:hypothetical protein